ncbi:MAG: carbonic anhydrase [Planctomycetes bacterium]|nr:carbonic anhydrase [Planctomycetota bacterium]
MHKIHRGRILLAATGLLALNAAIGVAAQKSDVSAVTRNDARFSPAAAWAYLQSRNTAASAAATAAFEKNPAAKEKFTTGQAPYAVIVGCSDSRVPPEQVVEAAPGDVFVVRVAGNVVSDDAIGSVEYAVKYLHVPLVVVLGHENCGAVSACLQDKGVSGALPQLLGKIRPAVQSATQSCTGCTPEALLSACIADNARLGMDELLNRSTFLRNGVKQGKVAIGCGVIDLGTSKIKWIVEPKAK